MNRTLQPEILDELPPADPRAIQSRRDLRRINALMGNVNSINRFLANSLPARANCILLEIGAGDGNIALQVAKRLASRGGSGRVLLLDRQAANVESTAAALSRIRWTSEFIHADIFDWLQSAPPVDILIANLFLHHFESDRLRELLEGAARITRCFAACEPRRNRFAPWFARHVWAIGCNAVTCHDAEISVRAGFRDRELSALWPKGSGWTKTEKSAGMFSHFFGAVRRP